MSETEMEQKCKQPTFFNPPFDCKPYDLSVYNQLSHIEQQVIKSCGVTKTEPGIAMQKMFFEDTNYFDSYWLQKHGAYFNTDYSFDKVMLKPANLAIPLDMVLPRTYPKSKKVVKEPPKRLLNSAIEVGKAVLGAVTGAAKAAAEKTGIVETKVIIPVQWQEVPTNNLSHSLFLNINESDKAVNERSYTSILFDCQHPDPPPPTPPELLAMQEKLIEKLEFCITLTAGQIVELLNAEFSYIRDSLFEEFGGEPTEKEKAEEEAADAAAEAEPEITEDTGPNPEYKTDDEAILALLAEAKRPPGRVESSRIKKQKLRKGRQIGRLVKMGQEIEREKELIKVYQNNVAVLLGLRDRIEDIKYDIASLEREYKETKKKMEEAASLTPTTPMFKQVYEWVQGYPVLKQASQKIMSKVRQVEATIRQTRIPTKEDLKEIEVELKRKQRNLLVLEVNFSNSLSTYRKSNEIFATVYYKKNSTELLADKLAGIAPIPPNTLKDMKLAQEKKTSLFKGNCTEAEKSYEAIVALAFTNLKKFIIELTKTTINKIQPRTKEGVLIPLSSLQKQIMRVMMEFPIINERDTNIFKEYKGSFEFSICKPKTPKFDEDEVRGKAPSFLWVTFESAVEYLTQDES